eukprot:SM000014S00239  [mRNA]  locus=s14:141430:141930:- [translate_table: standard]
MDNVQSQSKRSRRKRRRSGSPNGGKGCEKPARKELTRFEGAKGRAKQRLRGLKKKRWEKGLHYKLVTPERLPAPDLPPPRLTAAFRGPAIGGGPAPAERHRQPRPHGRQRPEGSSTPFRPFGRGVSFSLASPWRRQAAPRGRCPHRQLPEEGPHDFRQPAMP